MPEGGGGGGGYAPSHHSHHDAGGGGGGYGGGGGMSTGTTVVCASCGQTTTVPFEPKGDRPVYCKSCYRPKQAEVAAVAEADPEGAVVAVVVGATAIAIDAAASFNHLVVWLATSISGILLTRVSEMEQVLLDMFEQARKLVVDTDRRLAEERDRAREKERETKLLDLSAQIEAAFDFTSKEKLELDPRLDYQDGKPTVEFIVRSLRAIFVMSPESG